MRTFWTLNPRIMYTYQEAYIAEKQQEIKLLESGAYINGIYNMRAIAAAFNGNKVPYPKKPFLFENQKEIRAEEQHEELTEEQKIQYQRQLLMQLQIMQSNYETGKAGRR